MDIQTDVIYNIRGSDLDKIVRNIVGIYEKNKELGEKISETLGNIPLKSNVDLINTMISLLFSHIDNDFFY